MANTIAAEQPSGVPSERPTGQQAPSQPPLARLLKIDTSHLSQQVRPRIKPRGLPPALEHHPVWATRDLVEAQHFGLELLGPHSITITDPNADDFYASYHAVRLRDVTLGYLDYTATVRLHTERLPESYLVMVPMSGTSRISFGRTTTEATAITAVAPPAGTAMTVDCERQTPHLIVRIDQQALALHLARLLGRPLDVALTFDPDFNLGSPRANRWNFAIQMLHAELFETRSLLHEGTGSGQLEEFVMSSLLFAHRSNYSETLTRPGQGAERRVTRAAKNFIETHLSWPLSVGDIADAAGVSERTLQAAFQSELETTPITYLRNRRLDRARAELADAAAGDQVRVTSIATRWGFTHLGRFAAEYKTRFGESPSETLRG